MPERDIKAAMLPINIFEGDKDINLTEVVSRVSDIDNDTDLIILPETFSTGFSADTRLLRRIAEPNDGHTVEVLHNLAVEKKLAICGSFIAVENGNFFNRGVVADDSGNVVFYDKHHLFRYGGESKIFTCGTSQSPIVEYRTWKLKLSICYDLRFPVWNRCVGNNYDVLIVPANWVHSRGYAWRQLLIGRAIENQCYVLGCNRVGADVYGTYDRNDTMAFNHWGKEISDRRCDGAVYAILEGKKLANDRERFSPWLDADRFELM